ncbi:MAG: hypothetical protein HPY69_19400 [Armatimonadetes bacterium]|nr:hypothetical protein [Armatimonadota bacterium]
MFRMGMLLALCVICLSLGWPQGGVVQWAFEGDTASWQSLDPAAHLSVTKEQAVARVAGASVAEYAYEIAAGKLSGVATEITADTAPARSVRLWLRTSVPTLCLLSLTERDGSNYMAAFSSLGQVWQDIALDFSEFQLSDDSQDENGLLDPGQVGGLGLIDASSFVLQMAANIPFLVPPEAGSRKFWLDDVALDSESVLPRWETVEVGGLKGVRLDSFEGLPLQWLMISGPAMAIGYDDQVKSHGNLSLRLQYNLPAGKLLGLLTSPGTAPVGTALRLRLGLRSAAQATLLIGLKEEDGSQYNYALPLAPGETLQSVDLPLTEFKLGDDSADEDGKLTLAEVKELQVTDLTAVANQAAQVNTLWLDDIVFLD